MTFDYITIDIKAVTNELVAKLIYGYEVVPEDHTLIYKISDDNYYTSIYPTDVWQELICETQEEFINTVAQHKLERIL